MSKKIAHHNIYKCNNLSFDGWSVNKNNGYELVLLFLANHETLLSCELRINNNGI